MAAEGSGPDGPLPSQEGIPLQFSNLYHATPRRSVGAPMNIVVDAGHTAEQLLGLLLQPFQDLFKPLDFVAITLPVPLPQRVLRSLVMRAGFVNQCLQ